MAQALARTLRDIGGVPTLPDIANGVVARARAKASELDLGLLDDYSLHAPAHLPTLITQDVADACVEAQAERFVDCSAPQAHQIVAEAAVCQLAFHFGLDRMVGIAARKGKELPQFLNLIEAVLSHPQVAALSTRLLRHPDGKGLRAPSIRRNGRTTPDLLDTDLEEL